MSTTGFLLVAALLLTGLAATPADAHRFPGRYRWRGWGQRRYSPPAPTPTTPTPTPTTPSPCTCAPSAPTGLGGGALSAADVPYPDDYDCVVALVGMMTCGELLTGSSSSADAPAPGSECCVGLAGFFKSATAAGGGGLSQLRCLCPFISGDINRFVTKPMDPLQIIYLPSACGVVVPPLVIPLCLNASSRWVTTPNATTFGHV